MENLNGLILIILSLAVTRLSYLFVDEDGPYNIFSIIRDYFNANELEEKEEYNLIGEILSCKWCFSVWAGIFIVISYLLLPTITIAFSLMLTLSMLSIIMTTLIDHFRD